MKKILFNKRIKILYISSLVVIMVSFFAQTIFAAWSGTFYSPGETLNPECLPTDSECDVLVFPDQTGNTGKFLTTDGTNTSWANVGGSSVWGGITGTLSSQTDLQSALNGKQATLTTGTTAQYLRGDLSLATFPTLVSSFTNDSGYITNSSTDTLTNKSGNISQWTNDSGYTTNTGTVTSVGLTIGTAGSDVAISGSPITSTGSFTLDIPTASGSVRGVLSSADWTTFNSKAPTTSPTFATSITGSYLTASELLGTDGSKNIISLPVATYPSLTELTYLKGVTSAIQTQLNGKQATLTTGTTAQYLRGDLSLATFPTLVSSFTNDSGYITGNQSITLSGAVTGSGTTGITTTLANSIVGIANLSATGTPSVSTYLRGDNTWATISGGSPGGSTTQLQYNNAGSFGGITGATSDGTNLFVPTLYGVSSSGGDLTLSSTTHATKGKIYLGANSAYDEVNSILGIGTTSPATKLDVLGTTQTGSESTGTLNLAQTWNTSGSPSAIKLNITNTASGSSSKLLDLQVGGVSLVGASKSGILYSFGSDPSQENVGIGGATTFSSTNGLAIRNVAIGALGSGSITSGKQNVGVGYQALALLTTGSNNVATGYFAMPSLTTGGDNIAVGVRAMNNITTTSQNVAIGNYSGRYKSDLSTAMTGASNSVFIGHSASANDSSQTNQIVIGYNAAGNGSNTVTIGNSSITDNYLSGNLRVPGVIAIGTTNTTYKLNAGSSSVSGIVARFENSTGTCDINPTTTSLSCSSDINLKKNITTLDNADFVLDTESEIEYSTNLEKLLALDVVTYNWNSEDDTSNKHIGFIAQQVENIYPDLVTTDINTGLKSLNITNLIPYTIAGMQQINVTLTGIENLEEGTSFLDNIRNWMASASNGIGEIFTKKVRTEQICVKKSDGTEFCVNGDQLESAVNNINGTVYTALPDPVEIDTPIVDTTEDDKSPDDVDTSKEELISEEVPVSAEEPVTKEEVPVSVEEPVTKEEVSVAPAETDTSPVDSVE